MKSDAERIRDYLKRYAHRTVQQIALHAGLSPYAVMHLVEIDEAIGYRPAANGQIEQVRVFHMEKRP